MWPWDKPKVAPGPPPITSGSMEIFGYPAWLMIFLGLCLMHVLGLIVVSMGPMRKTPLGKAPHLSAHFLPQLVGFIALSWYGGVMWMTEMPAEVTPIYEHIYIGERVSCIMLAFQMYEIAAAIPGGSRLRGLHYEMIGHHCITLLLSVLCYKYQAFHYWAPCFMGMAEFSSIPLAFIDFFKQFPQYRERFPTVNELSRNIFAVLFLTIRGCYWPYSSFWFWKQSLQVLASGVTYTPLGVIYTFLVCNVMMTMLQWYWASLILTALYYLIIGDERHKQA